MKLSRESVQQAERVVSVSRVLVFQDAVALEKKTAAARGHGGRSSSWEVFGTPSTRIAAVSAAAGNILVNYREEQMMGSSTRR